jgi:NAD(P)-dependent dehydrogenase (short-subunit alcohol dehydrogenase family)
MIWPYAPLAAYLTSEREHISASELAILHGAGVEASAGADVIIHFGNPRSEAESAKTEILALERKTFLLQADLADPIQVTNLLARARELGPIYTLVNTAAIFEPLIWDNFSLDARK